MINGTSDAVVIGVAGFEADLLYLMFHSAGGLNWISGVNDSEMDALLTQSRTTTDPAARQEVLNQVQIMLVEKAYFVPLAIPTSYSGISKELQGAYQTIFTTWELADAYLVNGE